VTPTYKELVDLALHGDRVDSRYGPTLEALGLVVRSEPGELPRRRGINRRLGWVEALMVIGGTFDAEVLKSVAPRADHSLFTGPMAYGPRLRDQLPTLLQKLREDPATRQAVAFVGSKFDGPTSAQPCTSSISFVQRAGYLHAFVSMRSWDLLTGLPYDLMVFHALTAALARCLTLERPDAPMVSSARFTVAPGMVQVQAASAHVYVEKNVATSMPLGSTIRFRLADSLPYHWEGLTRRARVELLYAAEEGEKWDPTKFFVPILSK
jgi:hypothetical protein